MPDFWAACRGDIIGDCGFTPTKKTYYIVRLYASKIKRHG